MVFRCLQFAFHDHRNMSSSSLSSSSSSSWSSLTTRQHTECMSVEPLYAIKLFFTKAFDMLVMKKKRQTPAYRRWINETGRKSACVQCTYKCFEHVCYLLLPHCWYCFIYFLYHARCKRKTTLTANSDSDSHLYSLSLIWLIKSTCTRREKESRTHGRMWSFFCT